MNITKICLGESAQLMRQHDLYLSLLTSPDYLFRSVHFSLIVSQNRRRDVHEVIQKERSAREQP